MMLFFLYFYFLAETLFYYRFENIFAGGNGRSGFRGGRGFGGGFGAGGFQTFATNDGQIFGFPSGRSPFGGFPGRE